VQGEVELAVAAAVQAVAVAAPRAGGDRGDAADAGELRVGAEAFGPGGLGDQLGGRQWPAAGLGQQRGGLGGDEVGELAPKRCDLAGALADRADQASADANAGGLLGARQAPGDLVDPLSPVELAERDLQLGPQRVQMPAQLVLFLGAGDDEVVVIVTRCPPRSLMTGRWTSSCCSQARRDMTAVLDRPHAFCVQSARPVQQLGEPGPPREPLTVGDQRTRCRAHRRAPMRALVRVRPDHDHLHRPARCALSGPTGGHT
jgi:hypothetical protein